MHTKIFLDSGDSAETKACLDLIGSLDGQTTNPTLVSKHPIAKERFEKGQKFTPKEIMDFYKGVIVEISSIIPDGSVSVEVYADAHTTHEEMIAQARAMFAWIPNAHIKLPTTHEGLLAAEALVKDGIRVNMTLCFTEDQAAAVYAATRGARKGQVFVSPFIGRLDDQGVNGIDLVKNIVRLYKKGDGHVEILAASVRTFDHFCASLACEADIITAPLTLLKTWTQEGKQCSFGEKYAGEAIAYKDLDLNQPWQSFDITHPLTDRGIEKFSNDWNSLIKT